MCRLIQLVDLSLYFNEKICFEAFNFSINSGQRIALIGDNGSGKSSMLKIINKTMQPSDGYVLYNDNLSLAYVPQLIQSHPNASGAERFNLALTKALGQNPDVLLLDEPTNHLDSKNRQSLLRLLNQFRGTLIFASHDLQLLRADNYCFWQFHQQEVRVFEGSYDNLQLQRDHQRQVLEEEIESLRCQKKQAHQLLMKEQKRAKGSRLKGEKSKRQAKWPSIVSNAKASGAQATSGKKTKLLAEKKGQLLTRLSELKLDEDITPHFALPPAHHTDRALVTVSNGSVSYGLKPIVNHININMTGRSRLAITGSNGSGKSTILKAIKGNSEVSKEGLWLMPPLAETGYLDQHYCHLDETLSVLDIIAECRCDWSHGEIRNHLNNFLFRKNEQVYSKVATLSGGEKVRLSLAKIAALTPVLLILDELTNNLDLKTRQHVITLLKNYPGAFIVISHDDDFLNKIDLTDTYTI